MFFQLLLGGLSNGAIYALLALGITVVFKATEVANFAAGELLMVGAYMLYTFYCLWQFPYLASFLITAFLVAVVLGVIMERLAFRPLASYGHLIIVMATVALGISFKGAVRLLWGSDIRNVPSPFGFEPIEFSLGAMRIAVSSENIAIILVCLGVMTIFFFFFQYSKLGKTMRATSENQLGAMLVGINVKQVFSTIWATGTVICLIAGMLFVPIATLHIEMGSKVMLKSFAACLLGGFGNLPGALLGGILMGIIETLFGGYVTTAMMDISSLMVIAVVLIIKPQGLFGGKVVVKV